MYLLLEHLPININLKIHHKLLFRISSRIFFLFSRSEYTSSELDTSYLSENGTWKGIISLLISGQTDVAIGQFGMTAERKNVVNFISVTTRNK